MNFERLKNLYTVKKMPIIAVKAGQYLEIHEKVWEWDNVRTWKFKWIVLKVKRPQHPSGSFTIRGIVAGITIEKIYPLSFMKFDKVLLLDEYKIRRSKLYYLRDKVWKWAKMKSIIDSERKGIDLWKLALEEVKEEKKIEEVKEDKVA